MNILTTLNITRTKKWLPILLILLGSALVLLTVGANALGPNTSGLSSRQLTLAVVGIMALAGGAFLALPIGQSLLQELYAPSPESERPVSILLVAAWFGLLTGFVEVGILARRKFIMGLIINRSWHAAWMIPLGDVLLFLVPGLILFLFYRRGMRPFNVQVAVFVFSLLSAFSVLLMFPTLHLVAALLLSVGLATQLSRMIARRPQFLNWLVRHTIPGLIVVWIVLLAAVYGRQALVR
jgi:hypothetical protein